MAQVITGSFNALGQTSASLFVKKGSRFSFRVGIGAGAAWIEVEQSPNLKAWTPLPKNYNYTFLDAQNDFARIYFTAEEDSNYRLKCTAYAAGTFTYELRSEAAIIDQAIGADGKPSWQVTENGVEVPSKPILFVGGSSTGEVLKGTGTDETEGLVYKVYEEEVDLTGAAALFVNVFSQWAQDALVKNVQCYITQAITSAGDRVKVGIGPSSDPDKYGLTPDDDQESVANSGIWPDGSTVLAGATQIRVNGCKTDGSLATAGNEFTDGAVRVRAIVLQVLDLHEAIINFP